MPYDAQLPQQPSLLGVAELLPTEHLRRSDLRSASNLLSLLEDCHNYLYANEGLLKEKIFREVVKLLAIKLYEERYDHCPVLRFCITADEYRAVLAGRSEEFIERIKQLYAQMRGTLLRFFPDPEIHLSPQSIAYVVSTLQWVSLEQTAADVKGEAFQVFFTRYQRGDRGEFFTPHPIVELAVQMIAPQPEEVIIDPACGSGGFLIQAAHFIRTHFPEVSISCYINERLYGIEFNPDIATTAQLRLALEGAQEPRIQCANALEVGLELEERFDIVLANPPFGSRGKVNTPHLLQRYELGHRWQRAKQGWHPTHLLSPGQPPEILFIELCLRLLRPYGRMAIVLPDGVLQNATTEHVRDWIRGRAELEAVVSLPQHTFVPYGTGIKTSLLLLRKRPAQPHQVFMAVPQKIGYDVKGQPLYLRDCDGKVMHDSRGKPIIDSELPSIARLFHQAETAVPNLLAFWTPIESLNHRWDAEHYLPHDALILDRLNNYPSRPLHEVAEIVTATDCFRANPNQKIHYIAISDIIPQLSIVASCQVLLASEAPSRAKYRLQEGDIITAVSGASTGTPQHASAIVSASEAGAICSSGFAVLRNFQGVDPYYLLAFLRSEAFLRQVRRQLRGHAIPALSTDDLAQVLVPIPPEPLQRRIAQLVQEGINASRKGLDNLQQAESMIRQVLQGNEGELLGSEDFSIPPSSE